jgi:DNA invertase Pin-like site-specific DNA recombinase
MELREIYIDNGLSGQSFERPAFMQMISDMESGKINCCVVKDLSRLGRNAIDTSYYIEMFFPARGIRFLAVNDGFDSNNLRTGGIIVSLKNMVNEAYALEVGRKVRATALITKNKGGFISGFAPYGYQKKRRRLPQACPG